MITTAPLLAIDAPSLYFRAFHALPETITAPDGTPVNAIRGFMDMLAALVRTRRPDRLICALDADWRPAWRVALLPSYKAHRVAEAGAELVPDGLTRQVPILLEVLAALGIPAVGVAGYEADDVLGTLATREPGPVEVVTGDRDLLQLVDDARPVRVLYTGRGMAKLEVLDEAAVQARYGVSAAAYADFAVLRGDPSDGLPGVAGIGEKTAARLLTEYGDLTAVLAAAEEPRSGMGAGLRAKLTAARDYIHAAQTVVRVARDVPLAAAPAPVTALPADPDGLAALAERWNLASSLQRFSQALAAAT